MQLRKCLLAMILLGLTLVSLNPAHASTERRVALVIGNGAYDVSPLRNPVNDAQDMAALLRKVGFEVILKTDADKRGMIEAIEEFDRKLARAGIGLMYYAGHGMQIRGRNYLIPVRARIASEVDVELESVDVYRVLGRMEAAGTATSIIILDACRDNPFERAFRTTSQGLAQMDAPPGSIIAFATAPGGVAADGDGRNGVYTRHLLQNLARPGIGLTQALMDTRRAVAEETRRQQVPWESTSLMADIFLASTDITTAAPTQPSPPVQPPALPDTPQVTTDADPPRESALSPKPKQNLRVAPGTQWVNGFDFGYPPLAFIDGQGNPAGFDIDCIDWISGRMGFKVRHQAVDWDAVIPLLLSGKIDFIASGMPITDERKKFVKFTIPYTVYGEFDNASNGFGYAVRPNDKHLLDVLNEGLRQLMDDPYWDTLKQKWNVR